MQQTGLRRTIALTLPIAITITVLIGFTTVAAGTVQSTEHVHVSQQEPTSPANNTTVQHERPNNVSQPGDSQQVSQWLEGRLITQLETGTIEISQGQYERVQARLDDEYDTRLEQYIEIADETDSTADDQTANTLRETQRTQQDLANVTQEYQATYDKYETAREQGNETAARQTARELEALSQRTTTINKSLQTRYVQLENQTGLETTRIQGLTSNTTKSISAQQEVVREETLVETRLLVRTNASAVSFSDPIRITGQLTTGDGEIVANETARIDIGTRTYRTRTNDTGTFTVAYRPVLLPLNATNATVRYRPAIDSPYLGANSSVPVNVTQSSVSLSATVAPDTIGYSDLLETRVVATVRGRPVPSLPIETTLENSSAAALTNSQGEQVLTQQLPATIPPGQRSLRIETTRENIAIGPASTTAPVTVATTGTNLSVTATSRGEEVRVQGQLTTTDGRSVAGQRIVVSVGNLTQSVTTNRTGWYQATETAVPTFQATNNSNVTVTAQFDGSQTNLNNSQATTIINVTRANGGSSVENSGNPLPLKQLDNSRTSLLLEQLPTISLISGLLLVGAIAWIWRRESSNSPPQSTADTQTPSASSKATDTSSGPEQWLETAHSRLAEGNAQSATVAAYSSVRRRLEAQNEISETLTHREFRSEAEGQITDADSELLSIVSAAYEQATFASTIDIETATEAVEAAADLMPQIKDY